MTQRSQLISFVIRSELAAKQIIGTITKKIISSNLFLYEYVYNEKCRQKSIGARIHATLSLAWDTEVGKTG